MYVIAFQSNIFSDVIYTMQLLLLDGSNYKSVKYHVMKFICTTMLTIVIVIVINKEVPKKFFALTPGYGFLA